MSHVLVSRSGRNDSLIRLGRKGFGPSVHAESLCLRAADVLRNPEI